MRLLGAFFFFFFAHNTGVRDTVWATHIQPSIAFSDAKIEIFHTMA